MFTVRLQRDLAQEQVLDISSFTRRRRPTWPREPVPPANLRAHRSSKRDQGRAAQPPPWRGSTTTSGSGVHLERRHAISHDPPSNRLHRNRCRMRKVFFLDSAATRHDSRGLHLSARDRAVAPCNPGLLTSMRFPAGLHRRGPRAPGGMPRGDFDSKISGTAAVWRTSVTGGTHAISSERPHARSLAQGRDGTIPWEWPRRPTAHLSADPFSLSGMNDEIGPDARPVGQTTVALWEQSRCAPKTAPDPTAREGDGPPAGRPRDPSHRHPGGTTMASRKSSRTERSRRLLGSPHRRRLSLRPLLEGLEDRVVLSGRRLLELPDLAGRAPAVAASSIAPNADVVPVLLANGDILPTGAGTRGRGLQPPAGSGSSGGTPEGPSLPSPGVPSPAPSSALSRSAPPSNRPGPSSSPAPPATSRSRSRPPTGSAPGAHITTPSASPPSRGTAPARLSASSRRATTPLSSTPPPPATAPAPWPSSTRPSACPTRPA